MNEVPTKDFAGAENENNDAPASPTQASPEPEADQNRSKPKKRSPAPPIDTFADLLSSIYAGTFKRSALKKAELDQIHIRPNLDEVEKQNFLALASTDELLDKTRQLQMLGLRYERYPLQAAIREFAADVLSNHRIFTTEERRGCLKNTPESPSAERAVANLMHAEPAAQRPDGSAAMSKRQYEKMKINAVHCLLMHYRATRNLSVPKIQRLLQTSVWLQTGRRSKTDADKILALLASKDAVGSSTIFQIMETELAEAKRQSDIAASDLLRSERRLEQLKTSLDGQEKTLAMLTTELEQTKAVLAAVKSSAEVDRIHLKDDLAKMRGNVRRRLREELALLDEGLQALRREPPKVHVMIDHAERAIDGLKKELERLATDN